MSKSLPLREYLAELNKQTKMGSHNFNYIEIGKAIGLNDTLSHVVASKLSDQGLIYFSHGGDISITKDGIVQAMGYEVVSEKKMELNIGQLVGGNNVNSQFQSNSPGACQNQVFEGVDTKQLLGLLQGINDSISQLKLSQENESSLRAEIADIKRNLLESPNKTTIVQKLRSVCKLIGTSSQIATAGSFVLQLIPLIGI